MFEKSYLFERSFYFNLKWKDWENKMMYYFDNSILKN